MENKYIKKYNIFINENLGIDEISKCAESWVQEKKEEIDKRMRKNDLLIYHIENIDINGVQELIDDGVDLNCAGKRPLRLCCAGSWESPENIGESYFDIFKLLVDNGAEVDGSIFMISVEFGRYDIVDYLIDNNMVTSQDIKLALRWIKHSRKLTTNDRDKMLEYLESI